MRKLLADTSISNNPKIIEELKKAGAVFICDSTKEVADYIETL